MKITVLHYALLPDYLMPIIEFENRIVAMLQRSIGNCQCLLYPGVFMNCWKRRKL